MISGLRFLLVSFLIAGVLSLYGCAPPFPREAMDRVDRRVSFRELLAAPDAHKGTWVMLAGVIISAKNSKEGTLIEILQKPEDSDGRPLDTDTSEGRFLVTTDQYLDSAVYHEGRLIGVIGEVAGQKTMPLDEIMYNYPLLNARAMHLWRPQSGPHFFFGIGISGRM
jgi:outer membrane lipoprotein